MKKYMLLLYLLVLMLVSSNAYAIELHQFWQPLTYEAINESFDQGAQWNKNGVKLLDLTYGIKIKSCISDAIQLENVSMSYPLLECMQAGWSAEELKSSDKEISRLKSSIYTNQHLDKVSFCVYFTSDNSFDNLQQITFSAETDKGVRLDKYSCKSNITVSSNDESSWYNCIYRPIFKVKKNQINAETKYIRLWVYYDNKKDSITFSIYDYLSIQYNNSKPVNIYIPNSK